MHEQRFSFANIGLYLTCPPIPSYLLGNLNLQFLKLCLQAHVVIVNSLRKKTQSKFIKQDQMRQRRILVVFCKVIK